MMKCSFCGREFDEAASAKSCSGCSLFGGCQLLKCPHCGYESPRETRLVRALKQWKQGRRANKNVP